MLSALDLSHVRSLDARPMSKLLLGNVVLKPRSLYGGTERFRRYLVVGLGAGWPTPLYSALLHGQKREICLKSKPR